MQIQEYKECFDKTQESKIKTGNIKNNRKWNTCAHNKKKDKSRI